MPIREMDTVDGEEELDGLVPGTDDGTSLLSLFFILSYPPLYSLLSSITLSSLTLSSLPLLYLPLFSLPYPLFSV